MAGKQRKKAARADKCRRVIMFVMLFIGLGSLTYFTIYCYQTVHTEEEFSQLSELKNTEIRINPERFVTRVEQEDAPDILDEYVTLYHKNKSLIGWLKIDDTIIDYPVMQSQNEEYYLEHDFEQNYDKNGTLFINADARIWPRSQNIIIYGHNMKSGKMFGGLNQYKDKDYCDKHPIIKFDTLYDKGEYQVMYAFLSPVYEEAEITFKYYQFLDAYSEQEFDSHIADMKEMSLYDTGVTASYGDELLTLSTCDHDSEEADRFVVVAKKIK